MDEVIMAPSYILKDVWQLDESSNFGHFLGLSLNNLIEHDDQDTRNNLMANNELQTYLKANRIEAAIGKKRCRADWNLTD